MRGVDRQDYCPFNPYYDSPQQIGKPGHTWSIILIWFMGVV